MKAVWREGLEGCCDCTCALEGNLKSCDNWREISLLDVVGKVMGKNNFK